MLLTLFVALFTTPSASAATNNSELQGRLENLATELEKQRVAFHIPGMAIAVVRDDQIVFARGFGVADIDKKTPVCREFLFVAKFRVNSQLSMVILLVARYGLVRHCVRIV